MKYSEFFKMIEKKDLVIRNLPGLTDEQKQAAIDFFNEHPNYEHKINWRSKDLVWEDFEDLIIKEKLSSSQLKNFVKEGTHYLRLYTSDDFTVYQPLTWLGAIYLSKDAAPKIESNWYISNRRYRQYWDEDSFKKKKVFLIVCTHAAKYLLEITLRGLITYRDSKENKIYKIGFRKSLEQEGLEAYDIQYLLEKEIVPKAIGNFELVKQLHDRDLQDVKTLTENQRAAKELSINFFPRSFEAQVARKGYYEWNEDLTLDDLIDFGLISDDGSQLDERIKYFKVKGEFNLHNHYGSNKIKIKEIIWPLQVESGIFRAAYNKFLKKVVIPDYITSIEADAFLECIRLEVVHIPESVSSIGESAFKECSLLKFASIPNNVKSIGKSAFENCISLVAVNIPDHVTSIEWGTFYGCVSLPSITIPNNVNSICDYAFENCEDLKSLVIGNKVTSIGIGAFENCMSLKNLHIPNNVKSIGVGAFSGCKKLSEVYIGSGISKIGDGAFKGCDDSIRSFVINRKRGSIDTVKIGIPYIPIHWKGKA